MRLSEFIASEHEAGRQVFRRQVTKFLQEDFGVTMSTRGVGMLLLRMGYVRRRGRMKIPPLTDARKNRIRRFLL